MRTAIVLFVVSIVAMIFHAAVTSPVLCTFGGAWLIAINLLIWLVLAGMIVCAYNNMNREIERKRRAEYRALIRAVEDIANECIQDIKTSRTPKP